jgi:Fe-S-cluster containining protein
MSRQSEERRAKKRAALNLGLERIMQRMVGSDAPDAEGAIVRAQFRATNEILDEVGLNPAGVRGVASNAAAYTNGVLAKRLREEMPCACSAGCAWCCVLEISAWPAEVLQLAAWLESRNTPEEVRELIRRLSECVQRRDFENAEGRAPKVQCPLLTADGGCSIYEVRPSSCAAAQARDAGPCRAYAEGGDDEAEGLEVVPALLAPAETAARVLGDRGAPAVDGTGAKIDLHSGLARALELGAEATAARWLASEEVFAHARARFVRRAETAALLDAGGK